MFRFRSALACLLYFILSMPILAQQLKHVGEIKYISQQLYYVTLGTEHGVNIGDTLTVKRRNLRIGRLIVENVARVSSSCKLLEQTTVLKQNDIVETIAVLQATATPMEKTKVPERRPSLLKSRTAKEKTRRSRRKTRLQSNRIRGRLSLQALFFDDRTNAALDYRQLGLRTKVTVERFLGLPLQLRFRWRSRSIHRDRVLGDTVDQDDMQHNLHEFGLIYESQKSPVEVGLGRILSPEIRGIGYIDGGLFSYKLNTHFKVGFAGGTQPSVQNSAFQASRQKFGLFCNFSQGDYQSQRISSTLAFSGSYNKGVNSREFFYLQNTYSFGSRFSVYQSVEADLNRGWKNNTGQGSFQISNFFLSSRYTPFKFLALNVSYDARKLVYTFESRSTPDSLFDASTRQGLRSGFTLRLPSRIRLSGNFGVRFRQSNFDNTFSMSGNLVVPQIFRTWATVNARFSYFTTTFAKGYRPNLDIRFPIMPGLVMNLGAGSYINEIGGRILRSNWLETNGYYRINRRLFLNFGYRAFIEQQLKSGRLFLESGIVF